MSGEKLSMRTIREILRQKLGLGRSHREVAASLKVSVGVISKVVGRAERAGLDLAAIEALDDVSLAGEIYGTRSGDGRPMPDPLWIHMERQRRGVTLELLHLEYLEEHPDGYRYTQYCEHYRRWVKKNKLTMRQVHKAGEKVFLDYSGKKPSYIDRETGEIVECELFVATLGASSYTFAEATRTAQAPDFIGSNVRALTFFGGVPQLLVPDQMKTAVTRPCWYEPEANRTYEDLATHYGCAVLPARPRHPRDKAKVEAAVRFAQRWILARLRNEQFFSLDALNEKIDVLLEALNRKPRKGHAGKSRRDLYEALDRPALAVLPARPFVYGVWTVAKVNIDYHVDVDGGLYSVPYTYAREAVDVRLTAGTVEVYHQGKRVASHRRTYKPGKFVTLTEHMPKAHREHAEWTPSRLIGWGEAIGPQTKALVVGILESRPHPEQGYRTCLGLRSLAKRFGRDRLEAAAARAGRNRGYSYRHVKNILKNGLDRVPLPGDDAGPSTHRPVAHENIRGAGYYQTEESPC